MDATINRLIQQSTTSNAAAATSGEGPSVRFIPSSRWKGRREGYYFGTDNHGNTGYHWDYRAHGQEPPPAGKLVRTEEASKKRRRRPTGEELLEQAERRLQQEEEGDEDDDDDDDDNAQDDNNDENANSSRRMHRRKPRKRPYAPLEMTTPAGVESALKSLARSVEKNEVLRAQHADTPSHFMESELALHQDLVRLQDIAAAPHLYNLVDSDKLQLLVGLMETHENVDVALTAIKTLRDWLDPDVVSSTQLAEEKTNEKLVLTAQAAVKDLVSRLQQTNLLEAVVANLGRLSLEDDDEQEGVDAILTLLEHLLEQDPTTTALCLVQTTLLISWLLPCLARTELATSVKLHVSEVLASVLQQYQQAKEDADETTEGASDFVLDLAQLPPYSSPFTADDDEEDKDDAKKKAKEKPPLVVDGMEIMLQFLAQYRKRDPPTLEQVECLENVVNAMLTVFLVPSSPNLSRFLDGQGVELCLRCMREGVHSGGVIATKLLHHATCQFASPGLCIRACQTLVNAGGFKTLFPILMGTSVPRPAPQAFSVKARKQKQQGRLWKSQIQVNLLHVLYAWTLYLTPEWKDSQQRLVAKFIEADHEKCNRLVELLLKYDVKMRLAEYRHYQQNDMDDDDDEDGDKKDNEDAVLWAKVQGGGDVFYRIGAILAFVCVHSKRCHAHVANQLKLQNSGMGLIKVAVQEWSDMVQQEETKKRLQEYLQLL